MFSSGAALHCGRFVAQSLECHHPGDTAPDLDAHSNCTMSFCSPGKRNNKKTDRATKGTVHPMAMWSEGRSSTLVSCLLQSSICGYPSCLLACRRGLAGMQLPELDTRSQLWLQLTSVATFFACTVA